MKNMYFTEEHEWARVDGAYAYIGISDHAQSALGEIVFVELPEVGDVLEVGDDFGAVESVKSASDIYTPLSGKVVEVNESLEDDPALINEDAYENWIMKIEMTDATEVDNLMTEEAYNKFVESL